MRPAVVYARSRRAVDMVADALGCLVYHAGLSAGAREAARAGDLKRAKTLSDTWHEALNAISETDTYNLDKKQHALTMIDR